MPDYLLEYGVLGTVRFPLIGSGTANYSTAASGSLVGTNVLISKDGGAWASSTNTGTHLPGSGWYQVALTTSELQAKETVVMVGAGTLGTVVERQSVLVHTYGNVSAQYPGDWVKQLMANHTVGTVTTLVGVASANVIQWKGTAVPGTSGTPDVGTVQVLVGVASANVLQWKGTAVPGTQGTPDVGSAAFVATGTVTAVTNAVTVTGTPAVDLVTWKGTLAAGTQGKPNVGTSDFLATGTVTAVTDAVSVTGTPVVDVTKWKGTAALGTQGRPFVNVTQVDGTAGAAANLGRAAGTIPSATATGTLTTSSFETDLTETAADHFKGRVVIFISGVLKNQASDITAFTGSAVGTLARIVVTTMTTAPAATDQFIVV